MTLPTRPELSRTELIDWLRLIRSENVGPVTFRQVLKRYGSAKAALEALPELAKRGGRRRPIKICAKASAERELAAAERMGARPVALGTPAYPPLLGHISDAPPLLFVRGYSDLLQRPAVAIVGTRNASVNGRRMARDLARELSNEGFLVVSGLARGIDLAAHQGSLDQGTAAVMAGGIDVVYPPQHDGIFAEIEARGVLLSEMPLGQEPQARHFPRRNRLISGLVLGVVVVEATMDSGSMITAKLALEQNREVFAVPSSPLDPRAKGANTLIKQGANLVESSADVLSVLAEQLRSDPAEAPAAAFDAGGETALVEEESLESARAEILELLDYTAVSVDELIRECQFSPAVVTTVLMELELAGHCQREPGGLVMLVKEDREAVF